MEMIWAVDVARMRYVQLILSFSWKILTGRGS
jgi:hypothetical protein